MDKLRILNIFVLAFLVSLAVQYWFFPQKTNTAVPPDVYISVEKESITVPNIPKITVHNTTSGSILVNPCQDITLTIDSQMLTGIQDVTPDFCVPLSIDAQDTKHLSFDPLYKVFSTKPGKYIITLKTSF